eukprot:gnl/MRDRNA2_/MRDRNA2_128833_c0_seq1.p1 gnl/MRDRNA2_/MRDRNA2_128833_c0~~gnl/MRDRNA2_/MRDRNA2_128833_c0_seq1.p1  ORF type:complete len:636 (+),score=111.47 gnl/MRDRNA2_/MRDRNA2_128833_c0_seq1:94-2001(+)
MANLGLPPMSGVSAEQDIRFCKHSKSTSTKDQLMIEEMEKKKPFPTIYKEKVSIHNFDIPKLKPWIEKTMEEIVGVEDDIGVEYCVAHLEEAQKKTKELNMDPKKLQLYLTSVIKSKAEPFCNALWGFLLAEQRKGKEESSVLKEQTPEEKRYAEKLKAEEASRAKPSDYLRPPVRRSSHDEALKALVTSSRQGRWGPQGRVQEKRRYREDSRSDDSRDDYDSRDDRDLREPVRRFRDHDARVDPRKQRRSVNHFPPPPPGRPPAQNDASHDFLPLPHAEEGRDRRRDRRSRRFQEDDDYEEVERERYAGHSSHRRERRFREQDHRGGREPKRSEAMLEPRRNPGKLDFIPPPPPGPPPKENDASHDLLPLQRSRAKMSDDESEENDRQRYAGNSSHRREGRPRQQELERQRYARSSSRHREGRPREQDQMGGREPTRSAYPSAVGKETERRNRSRSRDQRISNLYPRNEQKTLTHRNPESAKKLSLYIPNTGNVKKEHVPLPDTKLAPKPYSVPQEKEFEFVRRMVGEVPTSRLPGKIESFNYKKGYGFITPFSDICGSRHKVFFHISVALSKKWIVYPPTVDEEVIFKVQDDRGKLECYDVILQGDMDPVPADKVYTIASPYLAWMQGRDIRI